MRIGLTTKLLVVLGLTSAVSVLAMGLAARWSFQHGFLDYLGQQELKRVEPLKEALVQAYDELGSWDFLARDPGGWPPFVGRAIAPYPHSSRRDLRRSSGTTEDDINLAPNQAMRPPENALRPGPPGPPGAPRFGPPGIPPLGLYGDQPFAQPGSPPPGPHGGQPFAPPGSPPPGPHGGQPFAPAGGPPREVDGSPTFTQTGGRPHDQGFAPPRGGPGFAPPRRGPGFAPPPPGPEGLVGRLRLLDIQGHTVAGGARQTGEELLTALELEGVVVGWLGLSPPPWLEDELAQRFNSQHNRSLLWISASALALAMLLGWVFGEGMLRRIRSVASGARGLARGDYGTRIAPKGRDELSGLAEDFNRLAAALERNEELRRRGMADVSHELRTPMAVARAELDALIDGIRPCTKERLEQLQGRLMALTRLLDDLYDLALSDAGALDYRHGPMDLSEIVEAAVSEMRDAFADKDVELRLECDDALPMEGDRGRLRQVLDNLLGNSLRYTDAGGFTRVVATQAGAVIRVSVSDTLPGVDREALEHLFDRFYRVEASRSRAKGGAGLGLAICRNIVEAHRGNISARAADCGGLEVGIRLPASGD